MTFEWDGEKAEANIGKHGVSFREAASVFADPDHSVSEQRFIILGESEAMRLLVVSYAEREGVTRIISAREATKNERRNYEEL